MSNNRKRRSSILKPQKMRNPLSDINIEQPMETTFMRQSRRVSFASSNFIKEFTADPEKNTIWHMSYEEAAISTDNNSSAPIAQEVLPTNSEANVPEDMSLTDSDEFNCTKICSFDNSVEEEHIGANELEMAHSVSQIELCTLLGDCNKTTDIHFKQDALQFCEIVNEQKIQPNITDLKLQNLQFNQSLDFANVNMSQPNLPSFIIGQENNCSIRDQLCRTALHDVDNVDRSDNTEVTKRRTIHFSQQSNDCDMDVTQSVPTSLDMSNKGNASQFKRRTLHFNQCSNDNNMDMTNIIPIEKEIDKENMLNTKHQIMHFNQESNYGDMELPQSISVGMKIIKKNNSTNRRTLYNQAADNGDMEITQLIPTEMKIFNKENIPNIKHQYIHFNQAANDGDMEMTQSLPAEMQTINNKNVCSTNREHISSTERQTLHFNQAANGGDMEMTQSIPPGMMIINKEHISNMNAEQASSTKRQTIHFNQVANGGNMEMTQSIPSGMKITNKEHISNMNKEQVSSTKRQTIHFKQTANGGDMEMTQSISAGMNIVNKENDPNIKRQSIHFNHIANDYYMEMTQAIPAGVKIVNQENVQRTNVCNVKRQMIHFNEAKRQTIHFNQTADQCNMEMTQAIPPGITIVNKENTSCMTKENVSNTKRQTIHFSEIEHDDNMVMTQSIPARMKIVSRGNMSNTQRNTIHFNTTTADTGDMEMTQAIPTAMKIVGQENITNTKRQIIHFNKATPAEMKIVGKENISNTKRQTIHFNQATDTGNMEMTQAIPAGMKIVSNSNVPNIKRQTIHFNQCAGDMEITQLIPAGMKIINKENVPTGNASNAKRQTINFNQISNDGNMDITLDIPTENTENEKIMTQDMHIGLKTKFAHVSNLYRHTVNISQISNDFGIMNSRSAGVIPIDNDISQFIPPANKLSNRLNSDLGSEMNTTKSNYYLDEITKSAPSGSRLLQKRENLFTKALLLDDESKSTGCNAELEKLYSSNDLCNANNIIDTQQQRRPTDNANNYNVNYTQTVLLNTDVLENKEQIEHAASNTLEDQYIHNEKREVPFHVKRQAMLMDSNTKVLTNASMNEDICIRIRYPNQSDDCLSFNSSKMNLTPARSIHEQTTFNLSKNLSSYIDNTERLINYKTDGNPTSDYSKIINDDLNLSVLKSNISENNRQDISYNEQNCFVKEVNICDVDVAERSNFENNTSVGDEKEENFHKPENVCKVGHKRLSDEILDNVSEMPHKKDRIVDVPGAIINFPNNTINIDERIDITDIIDCEKNDSVVLVNSSSESECELSNEKRDVSGLDASCSDVKISVPSNFANLTSTATNVSQLCENSLKSFVEKSAPHSETIQCENVSLIESVGSECSDDSESECDLPKNNRNHPGLDIPCFHAKISIPPNILNLIPNETNLTESCENSLKSFVEKSILHSETLLCESVSLIESVNSDCSDDFAAVSFGAKQVKKLINKSVVDSALTEGVENIDVYKTEERHLIINRVKAALEKICPDINPDIPVELVEEKSMEIPIVKKSDKFKGRFCKLFKNPVALDESDKKELTLEEKIKEKSKDTLWNIVQLHNEHFTFTFMYDTIDFRVNIDRDTEIVKTAEFFSRFCESTSHPSAIFVHRILKKKLSQNHIKSACGQKYNILSLLDYITILGEQMRDILNEFDDLELKHGLIIDSDLNATFCPTNLFLRIAFEVTINISNIDNVSEKEINVKTLVGNVRELEVRRLAKGCPQGLPFLRAYILSIEEYLRFLQNAKQSRIRK